MLSCVCELHFIGLCDCLIWVSFCLWQVPRTLSMGRRTLHLHRAALPPHSHCTVLHSPPISNATLPYSNTSYLWLLVLVFVSCSGTLFTAAEGNPVTDVTSPVEPQQVFKRSAAEGAVGAADYSDFQTGARDDEYPVSKNGPLERPRIILKWILGWGLWCGLDSSGSGQGRVASSCEHDNEPSGFVKCGVCLH
jgi:hypothetical protein